MNHLEIVPTEIRNKFSPDNILNNSFLADDVKNYFKEYFYQENLSDKNSQVLYILDNVNKKNKKTLIIELFKALICIKSKGYSNIHIFAIHHDEIYSPLELLKKSPLDTESYSPDLEYLFSSINNETNPILKNSMKVTVFSEILNFITKDEELLSLLKTVL